MASTPSNVDRITELAAQLKPPELVELMTRLPQLLWPVVTRTQSADEVPGSPAAILRAVREPPHVSREDVAELERVIAEGKLPVRDRGEFDTGAGDDLPT